MNIFYTITLIRMLQKGDRAPEFTLPARGMGMETVTLSEQLRHGPVVVYFYPRDMTPGCTTEACDFRDNFGRLQKYGVTVIGISKDTEKSHDKFIAAHDLPFVLGSDVDTSVIQSFGAWVEKSMYGKKYMGIERSTFLIGQDGIIAYVWPKVKVKGHVDEVIAEVEKLVG